MLSCSPLFADKEVCKLKFCILMLVEYAGIFLHSVDRCNEEEQAHPVVDKSNSTPLLAEKAGETA